MVTRLNVVIKRMSIHELDLEKDREKCPENIFPVGNLSSTVMDFFVDHISESRIGKSTKNCHFINDETWLQKKVHGYKEVVTDENFLVLSKGIAERLFTTMKTSSSRSSGSFFVIEALIEQEEFIALIKLDPKTRVQFDPVALSLSIQENILPDPKEKIHKCALIRTETSDQLVHLYVLDKQQNQGEVSKFFMKTFLESEELVNNTILTRVAMNKIKVDFLKIVPEDKKFLLFSEIDKEFVEGRNVDLETSLPKVLEKFGFDEAFIDESSNTLIAGFINSNPEYQSSFTVVRSDTSIKYQSKNNEIFFRYNKSIRDDVTIKIDTEGNTVITIDKKYIIDHK